MQHEFTNYVRQKQMALDRATGDWVLLMDADEQATHDLGEEIMRAVSSPTAADGYRIRRILYHLGHYYSHAIYPDTPVRLFRRDRGHIGGRDPHDKVVVEGRVERLARRSCISAIATSPTTSLRSTDSARAPRWSRSRRP